MAKGHEIIVTIDAEANVSVAVKGHKGSGCEALTQDIERALGSVQEKRRTREYRERVEQQRVKQS